VDDDVEVLDALQRQLRSRFDVTATCDGKEAIRLVVSGAPLGGPADESLRARRASTFF